MNSPALAVAADTIGRSFANDPELSLPEFPRFIPEIRTIPFGSTGLLFEGVRGTQVLSGRGARGFLPRLLPMLDGTRHISALLTAFAPVTPKNVQDTLALLYSRGLLEDGAGDPVDPALADVAAFLGRHVDATRVNRNRDEALARLARARLALWAPADGAEALTGALKGQGIGQVALLPPGGTPEAETDLLIVVARAGDPEGPALVRRAWDMGIRVLHACIGAESVEIGPLFVPGSSASYDCFRAIKPEPPAGGNPDIGLWSAVVALQAHHLLSRIGNPNLYNVCHHHRMTPQGAIYQEVKIARLPGCAAAGLGHVPAPRHDPHSILWRLHNAANGMPPRHLLSPRDYQMHYAATNLQITSEVREPLFGAPVALLPEGTSLDLERGRLTLEHLAALLRHAVGYTVGPDSRRIAPSAGGLGSAEVHLAIRSLPGIDPGLYRYYAPGHRLERIGITSDLLLAGALGVEEANLPPVVLVGTGNLTKVQQKYNDFAFRFANLDAGVVRTYLHDMAAALGVGLVDYADARDKVLADAMSIPTLGTRCVITYAMGLGGARPPLDQEWIRGHQYVTVLAELASGNVGHSHRAPAMPMLDGLSAAELQTLILRRRSVRTYTDDPVGVDAALAVLRRAHAINAALAGIGGLSIDIQLWLAVQKGGEGLSDGIHRYDGDADALTPVRNGIPPDALGKLMLQHALAKAGLVVLITGDFHAAVDRYAARGYRELIGRAGATAARILLAAEQQGLGACAWGGLSEDGWGPLLGIDRYTRCPLFGVSMGYPRHGA